MIPDRQLSPSWSSGKKKKQAFQQRIWLLLCWETRQSSYVHERGWLVTGHCLHWIRREILTEGRNEKEERAMHHRSWGNKVCWCWGSRRSKLERWADKEGRMLPVVFHHMHIYIHIYVFKYIGFIWPLMTGRTQNSHIFITNATSYFLDVAVSHLGYRKFYRVHFLPSQTT